MAEQPQRRRHHAGAAAAATGRRWLLFVHQLPASPSNLRVRTWRRLQQLGALPVKQAVYALPDSPGAREDFEWLKAEVTSVGGEATVFAADSVDRWADDALVEEFRRARQDAYAELAAEIEGVAARVSATRRPRGGRRPAVGRLTESLRARLLALEQIDFFGSAGRDRVVTLLAELEAAARSQRPTPPVAAGPRDPDDRTAFDHRLWVTRPRPGVDRMSSAWLIRRFIDPRARFAFAADRESLPADAIPFDMFGVEFTHRGEGCTFETLCATFDITSRAVGRIAAIVHDLDLKDGRFGAPEAGTVAALIDGLQLATTDDGELLERGIALFESLYLAFSQAERPSGPRRVATPPRPTTRPSTKTGPKRRRSR